MELLVRQLEEQFRGLLQLLTYRLSYQSLLFPDLVYFFSGTLSLLAKVVRLPRD